PPSVMWTFCLHKTSSLPTLCKSAWFGQARGRDCARVAMVPAWFSPCLAVVTLPNCLTIRTLPRNARSRVSVGGRPGAGGKALRTASRGLYGGVLMWACEHEHRCSVALTMHVYALTRISMHGRASVLCPDIRAMS